VKGETTLRKESADFSRADSFYVGVGWIEPVIIPQDQSIRVEYPAHLSGDVALYGIVQNGSEDGALQDQVKTAVRVGQILPIGAGQRQVGTESFGIGHAPI